MKETAAIRKLIENGIHGLINYQGSSLKGYIINAII